MPVRGTAGGREGVAWSEVVSRDITRVGLDVTSWFRWLPCDSPRCWRITRLVPGRQPPQPSSLCPLYLAPARQTCISSLGLTGKTLIDLPFLLRWPALPPRCVACCLAVLGVNTADTCVPKLTVQQSWPCNWTLQGHSSRLNVVLLAVTLCCLLPPPSHSAPSSPRGYLRAMTSGVVAA